MTANTLCGWRKFDDGYPRCFNAAEYWMWGQDLVVYGVGVDIPASWGDNSRKCGKLTTNLNYFIYGILIYTRAHALVMLCLLYRLSHRVFYPYLIQGPHPSTQTCRECVKAGLAWQFGKCNKRCHPLAGEDLCFTSQKDCAEWESWVKAKKDCEAQHQCGGCMKANTLCGWRKRPAFDGDVQCFNAAEYWLWGQDVVVYGVGVDIPAEWDDNSRECGKLTTNLNIVYTVPI